MKTTETAKILDKINVTLYNFGQFKDENDRPEQPTSRLSAQFLQGAKS